MSHSIYSFFGKHARILLIATFALTLVLHARIFRLDLIGYHVWRQTQTQTVIQNFAREDMHILNPRYNEHPETDRIMRMEFPVMQWLFAAGYRLFGNHVIITRIGSFIIGLFSVWGIYELIRALFRSRAMAFAGSWAFCFSPVFYYYSLNPLPDNFALCCGIWSLVFLFKKAPDIYFRNSLASAFFLLLATLAKLPFILYGAAPFVFLSWLAFTKKNCRKTALLSLLAFIILMLPALAWYAAVIPTWTGNGIVHGIMDSNAGIATLFYVLQGTVISTLPELLINYAAVIFFIAGAVFLIRNKAYRHSNFLPLAGAGIAVICYFLFEMNMIGTVHDYYLFPFLPFIFLLVAYGMRHLLQHKKSLLRIIACIAFFVLPLTAFLRADTRWNTQEPGFNPVYYNNKDQIRRMIPKGAYCIIGNDDSHFILLYYIDRKGWSFDNDQLNGDRIKEYMGYGAKYLFTDSRAVTENETIKPYLGTKIFEAGNVQVYELR